MTTYDVIVLGLGGVGSPGCGRLPLIQDGAHMSADTFDTTPGFTTSSGRGVRWGTFSAGERVYCDRDYVLDTVPAGMMAVDYLYRRGDVDTSRIVVAGGSFGALIAPALTATDERISALAILFGAGDLQAVIEANLPLPEIVRPPVAWIGSVLVLKTECTFPPN